MSDSKEILLKTEKVCATYESSQILSDVSIELHHGELVSLLGTSGCGKSTLFNVISGLVKPDSGEVYLEDKDITNTTGNVSYMLQKDLLLPYKTIISNVTLPLILRGTTKKEARSIAKPLFEEFGLSGTEKKYPSQLSGGMRQRAALLRTYLFSSKVALLDEPFSALDTLTKASMHEWYLGIMKQLELSTLFITHDIDEAIKLSDRIYILGGKPGHIIKEIIMKKEDVRNEHLLLSEKYLEYKKIIIDAIGSCM